MDIQYLKIGFDSWEAVELSSCRSTKIFDWPISTHFLYPKTVRKFYAPLFSENLLNRWKTHQITIGKNSGEFVTSPPQPNISQKRCVNFTHRFFLKIESLNLSHLPRDAVDLCICPEWTANKTAHFWHVFFRIITFIIIISYMHADLRKLWICNHPPAVYVRGFFRNQRKK